MIVRKQTENTFLIDIDGLDECNLLAQSLAIRSQAPSCIALIGTLGSGKTQFTRFFGTALGANEEEISSPTFVLMHQYRTTPPLCHVDAYRIGDEEEFLEIGIEEILDREFVTIIEWADRFPDILPIDHIALRFSLSERGAQHRHILAQASGPRSTDWLSEAVSRWSDPPNYC